MIQYIRTAQKFDIFRLQTDVAHLAQQHWKLHYNTGHYEGDWSVIPLRSINGSMDNTIAVHQTAPGQHYMDTDLLTQSPYLRAVLDTFECELTSARLMKLNAGAIIKEHTDQDMNLEAGEARFHIPVFTNTEVAFYILQDRIPMMAGECWYLNLSLPHRVHNAGTTDRIHLVIDCIANDWVKTLLSAPGLLSKDLKPDALIPPVSAADQPKILAALRELNTPVALRLIADMEAASQTAQTT